MDDLATWLRAQLDDDEAYARNAFGDHNQAEPEWTEIWSGAVQVGPHEDVVLTNDSQVSRHMVRHDPARVLREVEAKRKILAPLEGILYQVQRMEEIISVEWDAGEPIDRTASNALLKLLALPYSDRPGYQEEWRP